MNELSNLFNRNFGLGRRKTILDLFDDSIFEVAKTPDLESGFKKTEETGEDEKLKWTSETWRSDDGKSYFSRKVIVSKEVRPKSSLNNLEEELKIAIAEQRFEDAAKIRDSIKSLK